MQALSQRGISPGKANSLARKYEPETIIDKIEYSEFLVSRDKRGKIENPAGLIIYAIENSVPVPTNFVTSRRAKAQQYCEYQEAELKHHQNKLEQEYELFLEQQVDQTIKDQLPGEEFEKRSQAYNQTKPPFRRRLRENASDAASPTSRTANLAGISGKLGLTDF